LTGQEERREHEAEEEGKSDAEGYGTEGSGGGSNLPGDESEVETVDSHLTHEDKDLMFRKIDDMSREEIGDQMKRVIARINELGKDMGRASLEKRRIGVAAIGAADLSGTEGRESVRQEIEEGTNREQQRSERTRRREIAKARRNVMERRLKELQRRYAEMGDEEEKEEESLSERD